MKYLILILLLSNTAFANDLDCETDPLKSVANELSLPNCLSEISSNPTYNPCDNCNEKFLNRYPGSKTKLNKEEQKQKFLEVSLKEFKKNVLNNIFEAIKFSSLGETGSGLEKSIKACKMKSFKDIANNCKSPSAIKYLKESKLFNNLENETANEIAKMLSTDSSFNPEETLLKRRKPICFIPEKQLVTLTQSVLEESFPPELITAISKIDPKKYKSVTDFLSSDEVSENSEGDISDLVISINNHPFLKEIFKSSESAISFFKEIKSPYSPNNLREVLYSDKYGNRFDEKMAKNCQDSFNAFKESICSDEFEKGNVDLSPASNYSKISNENLSFEESPFATSEKLISDNLKLLKYCPEIKMPNQINLSKKLDAISSNLESSMKMYPLDLFRENKHVSEIGATNDLLCQLDAKKCEGQTSVACKIFKKYNNPDSVELKLAKSTGGKARELLRSMIGDTSVIKGQTREILVANGIIPKDDGSFVKQPDIPERQPDFFAKAAANPQPTQLAQNNFKAPASQPAERSPASAPQTYQDQGYTNSNDSQQSYAMPDFSDITRNNDELRDIQNEIRRRLSDVGPSAQPTKAQARKAIRDSFASKGRSLTPAQEESFATQLATPTQQQTSLNQLNREIASATATPNRAGISNTETQAEKWKKGQMNAALMGMAGAQGESKDAIIAKANAAQEKELTKVALNLADDPRVTLSDVFNSKINQNDPDTQLLKVLLKNKNNFVLQVKALNFKVIFDEKQNFNVLLESGDRKEAERIRPQLEMFLKKLRA